MRYEYGYDASGNQISLIDNIFQEDPADASGIDRSGARETAFAYDWRGNQISRTLPDGSTEYFFHDEIGRQIRHVSFEGRVTILEYDAYGRLARKLYFTSEIAWDNGNGISGHKISYAYDAFGRLAMESDSKQGTTRTEYDEMGRVLRVDSPQGVINYEYDIMTGQVSRTWSGLDAEHPVSDIVNTYDTLGRLETVTTYAREGAALTNPEATRYIYDIIGNLDRIVNSNGVISDYTYDELNRLKDLTHYAPDSTPETLSGNTVLQRYEYSYHANGNKSGEVFTDAEGRVHTWDWVYDALGRLTRESHDSADDSLDYSTDYAYDLVGNRLRKDTDKGNDGSIEEAIVSQFDANDRHLNDMKILNGATVERTEYIYNKTEQIAKTVTDLVNSRIASRTRMEYNVQGRMSRIIIETYVNGQLAKTVVQEYVYDSSGIKVKQTETVDEDADGLVDSEKITEYLNVKENHTGYSQVLEERTAENGGSMKVMTYTVGHDVLTQANALFGVLTLLADGHGSTRAVSDSLGGIAQQYSYDAYGNAVGFDPSQAMTNLLYSGEQFNPVSGLQYLRARWYNPQSGTFNRLDPYSGNKQSPLSFHKYAYAHMNPVMGTDPSGEFISILANFAYTNALRAYQLITAGFYLNVAKLAVSASAVIQNAYANMRVPYISNPDTAFRLGLIGGSIGAIVGFAINNTWFFSGLSAALISSATEAVNLFYAQTYQDQEVITLDNAPYFVGKMIEVALLTICGTLVAPVVDSIKSPLISILSDIGFGVGIDAITSVFSSIPENAITSIRNSLRR